MADDLIMGKLLYGPFDTMMIDQLRVTGSDWEAKQQAQMQAAGHRTYRMLVAHDGLSTHTFMHALHRLMHEQDTWRHLKVKSGAARGLLFRVLARAGATAYQLLETRHRSWPYRLFSLLRSDDAVEALTALAADHPCVLDDYTKSFVREYEGALAGPEARVELELVARFADTDTASTERIHSETQRRGKHKVWSHPPDLPSMSAWYLARTVFRGQPWQRRGGRGPSRWLPKAKSESQVAKQKAKAAGRHRAAPKVF